MNESCTVPGRIKPFSVAGLVRNAHPKRWPGPFPFQDSYLLSQGKDFCVERRAVREDFDDLIPTVIDQNPCAHLRMPRDMIFHGWSMRLFQAWQHSATMSS